MIRRRQVFRRLSRCPYPPIRSTNDVRVIDARTHVRSLVGREITTLTNGRPNRIIQIESDEVIVGTMKSPRGQPVPIAWLQDAIDLLVREGEITVDVPTLGHRSAFIGAFLATLPGAVVLSTRPRRVGLLDVSPQSDLFDAFAGRFVARSKLDQKNFDKAILWARVLVAAGLGVPEYRDTPTRPHVQLSSRSGEPALVTLYDDSEGDTQVYLSPYRSMVERLAPTSIASIERAAGVPIGHGNEFRHVTDALLEALTLAFREAASADRA